MSANVQQTSRAISEEIEKILGRRIGEASNFFAEGMDSLAALELTVAIEESLGVNCFMEDIFDAPSVAELSARLSERV